MTVESVREITARSILFEERTAESVPMLICSTEGDIFRLLIAAGDAAPIAEHLAGGAS